jgi:hypothetical protein
VIEIELRTLGRPERKAKLDAAGALALKAKIAFHLPEGMERELAGPWLWIQWIDPDGPYV